MESARFLSNSLLKSIHRLRTVEEFREVFFSWRLTLRGAKDKVMKKVEENLKIERQV
jgi:hypothetical protein